ncbi:MAG: PAS-domain containing protein [Paracoccaceae bacterium]|nr:PAS-domain containing protein [Paracoccaceae bacterium]
MTWMHVLTIVGSSLIAAFAALIALSIPSRGKKNARPSIFSDQTSACVMLFDREDLLDATVAGRAVLSLGKSDGGPWSRFLEYAVPRFPEFEEKFARLPILGRIVLTSSGPQPLTLRAEWRGGLARISLTGAQGDGEAQASDVLSYRALEEEVETLRNVIDHAPILVWREDANGAITWCNKSYAHLAEGADKASGEATPRLFPVSGDIDTSQPEKGRRSSIIIPESGKLRWFERYVYQQAADSLVFALPADSAVHAESSLRSFIQTLSKTFAQLSLGLAIFDKHRQLVLFNPSLVDLTGLSPAFLSARPTLFAFLDAMRESRMIPEPKDYKSWRNEISALEQAAASGQYQDIWALPNGQTYSVTGRPHPDGAVAFLFEDISAAIIQTRTFRAEMAVGQAVVDSLDEAIAVFSSTGMLVLSNCAYAQLWGRDQTSATREMFVVDAIQQWQGLTAPSPLWAEAQTFIGRIGNRTPWAGEARLSDGRLLKCRFVPLAGGSTLIGFTPFAPTDVSTLAPAAPARQSA